VAKAKALLAAAGVPKPSFEMMVPTSPEAERAAQVIQAMAGEAGFDIKIRATEFASALDLSVNGDYQAFLIGWSGRTDPDGNIYNFASCKGPKGLNVTHYCNKDVEAALDAARLTGDPAARIAQYKIVADHVLKERPIIYLWHQKWLYAATTKLKGFTPYPDGLIRPQGMMLQ
jgi:peptide/nickel transport system substrate-binding protein